MVLSKSPLPQRLSHLDEYLTTREAAAYLGMSYWHFMHLVEDERIQGIRILDRWLFTEGDLDAYRRTTRTGEIVELARTALTSPLVALTPRQHAICEALIAGNRPSEIARQQQQSRQAVHAQIALIRDKIQQVPLPSAPAALPPARRRMPSPALHLATTPPLME